VDPAEQLDVLRARDRSRGRSEVPTKPQDLVQRLDVLEPQRVDVDGKPKVLRVAPARATAGEIPRTAAL
jgi:hypothetical protein